MVQESIPIALIKGDGIGSDVCDAALRVIAVAEDVCDHDLLTFREIRAGADYYVDTGRDIEPGGEMVAEECAAVFLGAIGLPSVRHHDGTEISPHLRLRDRYQLYAGIRPVKAYPNTPHRLADPRASDIDLVILRESTEGLFYSAAVHGRSRIEEDHAVEDTLRITRGTTEKLHRFGFRLAAKRKQEGHRGRLTCVDKANVFASMAFFRRLFDEVSQEFPDVDRSYNYVDAQALDLIRRPWDFDVLVTENMFGDILSDLAGGLVGGMGMAPCAEIGDTIGLFQPAHGSAPDIMGQDRANPVAAILSGALMLDYLGEKMASRPLDEAARVIRDAIQCGFEDNRLRPMELGGEMGTEKMVEEVVLILKGL